MAAVTTTAVTLGLSAYSAYAGAEKKKMAQQQLNNYNRQDLKNPYENIQISTIGSDLIREESGRTAATLVQAARESGIRGVMGAIPKIQALKNMENKEAQKYLDDQIQRKEYAIAGDETSLRSMKENRDNANIAALSSQIDAGNQDMWNGLTGVAKSISYGANNINFSNSTPKVESIGNLQSQGLVPLGNQGLPTSNLPSIIIDPNNKYNY